MCDHVPGGIFTPSRSLGLWRHPPPSTACQHYLTTMVERDNYDTGGYISGVTVNSVAAATSLFPCYPIPNLCNVFDNCTASYDITALAASSSSVTIAITETGTKTGVCQQAYQDSLRSIVIVDEVRDCWGTDGRRADFECACGGRSTPGGASFRRTPCTLSEAVR